MLETIWLNYFSVEISIVPGPSLVVGIWAVILKIGLFSTQKFRYIIINTFRLRVPNLYEAILAPTVLKS